MSVVVTADDFGLCAPIDDAICLLHDRGVVRRASLVVNGPSFESSVEALRRRPALEVAVHLNLTDGRPVLPVEAVRTLVDERGMFRGGRHYGIIANILAGRMRRPEIHHEWRAQIDKARRAGLAIQELNSHGHLHLLPHLHTIVIALQREFGIPQIRLVRSREWPRGVLLHACSRRLRTRLERDGVSAAWPDRTLGLRSPGAVDPRISVRELRRAGEDAELIVHPSHGANDYHRQWGYAGDDVLQWLLGSAAS